MIIELNYTPTESLELIKNVHKQDWLVTIKDYIKIIIGVAKTNNISLHAACTIYLKLEVETSRKIKIQAALQYLTTSNHIDNRLNTIQDELQQLIHQSASIENRHDMCQKERSFIRQAIYNKSAALSLEKEELQHAVKNISNLQVEATLINPNGSQQAI